MSPQAKKASQPQAASAKLASSVADKTAKSALSSVETTRNSAENVVKIGTNAVRELFSNGAGEAQKAQEKAFAIGREGAASLAKSADAVTKLMYESVSLSRENVEAAIECSNITASFAKDVSEQLAEYANDAFSSQMELSKEAFGCRTINDVVELQNKFVRNALDSFFGESLKISEKLFEYTTEALEPVNERIAQASEQLSKALASK